MSTQLTTPTTDSGSNGAPQPNGAGLFGSPPQDAQPLRSCAKCGAPMQPLQDWCLQCGAGAPGSLGGPSRTAAIAVLAAVILLVAGASAAGYAALSKKPKAKPVLASAKAPLTTTTPLTTATPPTTPATPGAAGTAGTGAATNTAPGTPTTIKATPPKIPLQTPTPSPSESGAASGGNEEANNALFGSSGGKTTTPSSPSSPTKTTTLNTSKSSKGSAQSPAPAPGEGSGEKASSEPEPPSPILLDTNAASTYNPYTYPTTLFGDPSLVIDGEAKTAWTAQVDPTSAPKMAEGVVLDMKSAQKVGRAVVKTSTKGITVTMYGANGQTLPASITDHAWKRLSGAKVLKKSTSTIKLKTKNVSYRFVLLWITKAPPSSTPSKPGAVSIDELELFP